MHRHRCLSRTLPPARVGVRLQATPAAAATSQLHYPDSSRLVSTEARCEAGLLAVVGTMGGCARDLVRRVVARFGSGKPFVSRQQILVVRRRRSWRGDAFCRQDADHSSIDISEQGCWFQTTTS